VKVILAILAIIVIPILILKDEQYGLELGALSAIVLVINEFVLEKIQKRNIRLGATIQELFDTKLYQLDWNSSIALELFEVDKRISDGAAKVSKKDKLANWYFFINDHYTNENIEILYAQYSNMDWDANQRKKFQSVLIVLLIITFLALGFFAWELTFKEAILSIWVHAIPFVLFLSLIIHRNSNLFQRQEQAKTQIYNYMKDGEISKSIIRSIQNTIFKNRLEGDPVPNFIYNWYRKGYENHMKSTVERLHKQNKTEN
jgi:hypothetical protein